MAPKGERYNNKKKIDDKELILNTEIYNHQYINREAIVKSVPIVGDTAGIKVGDRRVLNIVKPKTIGIPQIIKNYDNIFKVIPKNVTKYFDEKILKLNNLSVVDLDHNVLEFLQLKGLLDKDLIKPLYLS